MLAISRELARHALEPPSVLFGLVRLSKAAASP